MRESIEASWGAIERWLLVHAPAVMGDLRPPADSGEISRFERRIGRPFPDDLRASYASPKRCVGRRRGASRRGRWDGRDAPGIAA